MNYFNFTAEEASLIGIYKAASRSATAAQLTVIGKAHPNSEMRSIAQRASAKLAAMTDAEFAETEFPATAEDET
ncbi:MAG: transposon-transfer assisting family protein [Oscillospiraceae bacterium]|jgi:hypothetical protein|nr:transposon-transfer assisting family protein [Oscillospiraceae bacterium]